MANSIPSKRCKMLGETIKRIIILNIQSGNLDLAPHLKLLTITRVIVSPDAKFAVIYFQKEGIDANNKHAIVHELSKHIKRIRSHIGKNLNTKFCPNFTFQYDDMAHSVLHNITYNHATTQKFEGVSEDDL